jgi:hypothetical protein
MVQLREKPKKPGQVKKKKKVKTTNWVICLIKKNATIPYKTEQIPIRFLFSD